MQTFKTTMLPTILPAVRAIARRMRLDYFGIDCAIDAAGTLTLFEANATMTMLRPRPATMWEATVVEIQAALVALIDDPARCAVAQPPVSTP